MHFSIKHIVLVVACFHAAAISVGVVIWHFDLPDSSLIMLGIPVLLASTVYPRNVLILMSFGGLCVSFGTLYFMMDEGVTWDVQQTVVILFLTVTVVAEVIHQVVGKLNRAQLLFEQSEGRFRLLVENSPDAILVMVEEKINFINPAACKLLGVSTSDALKNMNGIDLVHPEDRGRARKNIQDMIDGNDNNDLDEYRILRPDGKTIYVEAVGMPIEIEDQVGLQVVMRDITERKRVDREREVMASQMRQTQKLESLGVLAGGIAHEFNNILVGIMGNAQLLLNDVAKNDPKRKHYLTIIDAAHRATGLCMQMRAYAGDEQGQSIIALDVSKEVLHIEKLLNVIGINAIELRMELQDNLPRVKMDPAQLQQILITLVTNAAEAIGSNKGHITIRNGKMECDAKFLRQSIINEDLVPGTFLFLEISDTGCGIDDEVLPKIFDPFFTTKFAGRGLGLAAVVGMVRSCHGDIRVKSKPGEGSTFTVYMPVAHGPSPDALVSYQYEPEIILHGEGPILYVDNDAAASRYAKQVLERSGFTVTTASDLSSGLSLFEAKKEHLRALFINPAFGGLQSVESWKRAHQENGNIPIIILGNANDEMMRDSFSNKHPAFFLKKPFKRRDLLLALRDAMQEYS